MGIITAVIPDKPDLGLNECYIILVNKVSFNQNSELLLTYSKLKKSLLEDGMPISYNNTELLTQYFEYGFQDLLSNLNIRYMNDITHCLFSDRQIQMNFRGPDIIYQPFRKIDDVINIKSELKKSIINQVQQKKKRWKFL